MKAAKIAKEHKTPVRGMIVNKIRSPKHEYNLKEIEKISDIPVLAKIKEHKKMAKALHTKTPISILDEKNTISKEIKKLGEAITGSPEKKDWFQKLIPYKPFIPKEEVNRTFYKSQL